MTLKAGVMALALLVAMSGCAVTRVDSPISFKSDRRLSMESPDDEDVVRLPVEVRWKVTDFSRSGGNHFGVFVDRVPVGTDKVVRLRVCTEGEKLPPQIGEFRKPCEDDRKTIFFTDDTSFTFECFEPRFDAAKRERNAHDVRVVLLDGENRRVGQAAANVRFDVNEDDADRCRGLVGDRG